MSVIWWKCTTVAKNALERIVVFPGYKCDIKNILLLFLTENLVILHGMYSCVRVSSVVVWHYMDLQINQIHILYIHFHYLVVRLISKFPPKNKLPLAQVYLFHDYDIVSYKFSGKFPKDCNILSTFLFFLFAFYNTKIHICISNRNSSWVIQFYHVFNLDACVYTDRKIQI